MKKNLIIFGMGDMAQLAHHYFSTDSNYVIVAFTVDADYVTAPELVGLPVVPLDELVRRFPPDTHEIFIAVGYTAVNQVRKEKYLAIRQMGYRFANYLSSRAILLNEGRIGDNCFILEGSIVQPFAAIGNNVVLWSGSHVGHHSIIHDHCFIAPCVAISGAVEIEECCFIGINATLRDHIKVGKNSVVGAGALLLADTAAEGLYKGTSTERAGIPGSRVTKI